MITGESSPEYFKRLARKVGPVYFLIPHDTKSSIRAKDVFTKDEMRAAEDWYYKQCPTAPTEADLIDW